MAICVTQLQPVVTQSPDVAVVFGADLRYRFSRVARQLIMVTIKRYIDATLAGLEKSVLEAEGISAFVAEENTAVTLSPTTVFGGVRLQVQDEDADRARAILDKVDPSLQLSDDFVPPPDLPPDSPTTT